MPSAIDDVWAVTVPQATARFDAAQTTRERASVEKLFDFESPHQFHELGTMTLHGALVLLPFPRLDDNERRFDFLAGAVDLPLTIEGDAKVFGINSNAPETAVLLRWSPNRPTEWVRPNALLRGSEHSRNLLVTKSTNDNSETIHEQLEESNRTDSCHILGLGTEGSALHLISDGTGRAEWLIGLHGGRPVAFFSAMDPDVTTFTVRPSDEDETLLEQFRAYASHSSDGDRYAEYREMLDEDLRDSGGAITPEIRGILHLIVPEYAVPSD